MNQMKILKKILKKTNGDVNIAIEHSQLHLGAGFMRNRVKKRIPVENLRNLDHVINVGGQGITHQIAMHLHTKMGMS